MLVCDPVKRGFVASLNRRQYTVHGAIEQATRFAAQGRPPPMMAAFLTGPSASSAELQTNDVLAAGRVIAQEVVVVEARNGHALLVRNSVLFGSNRKRLLTLATQHRIPT